MSGSKKKTGGISIHVIHIAMILCAVVIIVLLLLSTVQTSNVFSALSRETGNYLTRQKAAHDLMEASDYLTEMVQRFTLEGDTVYLDNYFDEAFVSKRREAAILSMSENNAESSLVQQLQEAMDESQTLMYREYYAMKLLIDAREIRNYPETLRAIELKEEDIFLSPEAKTDLAQRMVMGSEYYASKEIIRTKLKTALDNLDDQMARARQETSGQMVQELSVVRAVVIVLVLVLVLLIVLTARLSTLPLLRAVDSVRQQKEIPAAGSKEFRLLAESYNELARSCRSENKT